MELFHLIDVHLNSFAERNMAEVFTKGTWIYGTPPDKIKERRVLWIEGVIGKGVIIQPNFTNNIDPPFWDFWNVAWLNDGKPHPKGTRFWQKYLLRKVEFLKIEQSIEDLLNLSTKNLSTIRLQDLRRR